MNCILCNQEKPKAAFSTIARFQSYDITGAACSSCYWWQLVLVYPEYQEDGSVIYREYEEPLTDYIYQMGKWLRGWIHDPAVLRKYAGLGSINEQVAPFWAFAKGVRPV
jgi:hypothetical protein